MELVSVVLPVRDGEAYLGSAISSILGQSLEQLELIVVDDGSRDSSRAIALAAAERDDRVRVLRSEGKGVVDALETGVAVALGEFVARMDHDDVALPWRLARQVEELRSRPDLALIGGAIEVIDAEGRFLRRIDYPSEPTDIRERIFDEVCFASATMTMRLDALKQVGGFRRLLEPAEDVDLCLRLAERFPVANLEIPVLRYRVHGQNVSVRALRRQMTAVAVARAAARAERDGSSIGEVATLDDALVALGVSEADVDSLTFEATLAWIELLALAEQSSGVEALVAAAETLLVRLPDPDGARERVRATVARGRIDASPNGHPDSDMSSNVDGRRASVDRPESRRPHVTVSASRTPSLFAGEAPRRRTPRVVASARRKSVRAVELGVKGCTVIVTEGPAAFARRFHDWRYARRHHPVASRPKVLLVEGGPSEPLPDHLRTSHMPVARPWPEVSVVVVVWNALVYAKACVESLFAARPRRAFEVIVVDNGSRADVLEWLNSEADRHAGLGFVRLPSNVGFARGANVGVRQSRGRYVIVVNSDTLATPGWADALVDALEADPTLGIVSPVTNFVGEGDQIDPEAVALEPEDASTYAARVADRNGITIVPERIAFFCVGMRRELFDQLNGLDEGFGLGNFEDEDFCLRTQALGQSIGVVRRAFVYHHGGKTFAENRVEHSAWMERNYDAYLDKVSRICSVKPVLGRRRRMTGPTVSVIVRTQNRPDGLRVALNSLAWQSFEDFEVVVVNDGGAPVDDILDEYRELLEFMIVRNDSPHGQAQALNDGVASSRGKYIAYLDDDDILYPFHLASLMHGLEDSELAYSHYNRVLATAVGNDIAVIERKHSPIWPFNRSELLVQNRPAQHTWLHSRALFEKLGGFDVSFTILQDWDFLLRASAEYPVASVPRETCEYRIYDDMRNSVTGGRARALDEVKLIYERFPATSVQIGIARSVELAGLEAQLARAMDLERFVEAGQVSRESAARTFVQEVFGFQADVTSAGS